MSVAELQTKVTAAKKAYKANKEDKSLKVAYKALKAELEAAQAAEASGSKKRKASEDEVKEEAPAKKAKTASIEDLKAAAVAAKKAYKANKEDKSLKAAYKEAKAAVEAAEAAEAAPAEAKEEAKEEAAPVNNLDSLKKNKPAAASTNESDKEPTNKLWVGNLSFKIQDEDLKEFFKDCGEITNIHYLEHRDTRKFKGCGFIEFATVEEGKKAFALGGMELLGREINIDFATPRKGGARPLSARPDNCTTVFAGNLSYSIDEDAMYEFAKDCGEIKGIRWLTDRETGDFKGCGFVEFHDSESVDKFVKKNGESLLGRPIRLDYSAPRAPRN